MRKYIICIWLFICLLSYVNGQDDVRKIIDSTKKELNTAKGNKRIDCLNLLAECYNELWQGLDKQFDTACAYSNEAYQLAKNSNYKRGLGYALLMKATCFGGSVDDNKDNNNSEANYSETYNYANKAIQIGEEIKDYRLAGDVYDMLKWLERWKGDSAKFKFNVEKAIYYYEKPVTSKIVGHLNVSECNQCQGNEGQLAWLYQLLAGIIYSDGSKLENITAATEHFNKAVDYYEMLGNKNGIGGLYSALRQAYFRLHQYKLSEDAALKSISYFHDAHNVEGEIGELNEMCKVYEITGEFEKGISYGKRSIKLAEGLSSESINKRSSGQGFFWLSRLYKIAGDYETALELIKRGKNYYNPKDSTSLAHWAAEIGDAYRLVGNYDSALYYLKTFDKSVNNTNNFGVISLGYLYLDLKQYDNALATVAPFSVFLKK